jgi:type II secretory pathway pseudopilin PulG
MVVVMIIGVLAALAVPSLRISTFDRHAYQDAGAVLQLFREARLRAVARGAATLVSMTANGTSERGQFNLYEAVQADPNSPAGTPAQVPVASCKAPTIWNIGTPTTLAIDGVSLDGVVGTAEVDGDIESQIYTYDAANSGAPTSWTSTIYVCYTPVGRSYISTGGSPTFIGTPTTSVLEVRVLRGLTSGLTGAVSRSVLVAPNGMPRLFSKVL